MPTTTHKIDSYKIKIFGNDQLGNDTRWGTKIIELYSGTTNVATAYFARRGASAGDSSASSGQIIFIAPEEQYAPVIDLLRNELPVFISWVPHNDSKEPHDGNAFFHSAKEPVGEAEDSEPRQRADRGPTPIVQK